MQNYELAFRMQAEVPELMDIDSESRKTLELYGVGAEPTNDYGRRCLLARRLAEQGVRFIHLYHRGWDHHGDLIRYMKLCGELTEYEATGVRWRRGL